MSFAESVHAVELHVPVVLILVMIIFGEILSISLTE